MGGEQTNIASDVSTPHEDNHDTDIALQETQAGEENHLGWHSEP